MNYQIKWIFIFYILTLIGYAKAQAINLTNESEDCIKFKNFFNIGSCCDNRITICNNGHLERINLPFDSITGSANFDNFPLFGELNTLTIEGDIYGGILPSSFFNLPKLERMWITNSNIQNIPENINPNSPLKEIYLGTNHIKEFPSQFVNLKNLKILDINHNEITGEISKNFGDFASIEQIYINFNHMSGTIIVPKTLKHFEAHNNNFNELSNSDINELEYFLFSDNNFDNDVFDKLSQYNKLKNITLSSNKRIDKVSSKIRDLKNLESLELKNTNIKELPSQIFLLDKLKNFDISENPNLNTKIINFGNTPINTCNFSNIKILCYQPNSCTNINSNMYTVCNENEIKEIIESQNKIEEEDDNNKKSYQIYIFIGIAIFVILSLIISLIIFLFCKLSHKKNKNEKEENYNITITSSSIKSSEVDSPAILNSSNTGMLMPGQSTDITSRNTYYNSINPIRPANSITPNIPYTQNVENYYMAPSPVPTAPSSYLETNSEIDSIINDEDPVLPSYEDIVNPETIKKYESLHNTKPPL